MTPEEADFWNFSPKARIRAYLEQGVRESAGFPGVPRKEV